MNEKLLEDIGLTKGEVTVYLALLKIGETTTGKIIEQAGISSGKIYEILDKLMKKGLVSYIIKDKTKYFSAASPKRILDFLHEKEDAIKKKEQAFLKELPQFLQLENVDQIKTEIRLFEGFKGIQTIIYEVLAKLTSKDEIIGMGIDSKKSDQFNRLWPKWHKERIKKKIKCKILFSEKGTKHYNLLKKLKHTEIRTIEGITPAAIDVMGNQALIFTHGEQPSCLYIKHPEIVQSFKTFFNTIWNQAKE